MDQRPDFNTDAAEGLRALKAVRAVFPTAILAGGYLRDMYFRKPAKDIDLFVPCSDSSAASQLRAAGLDASTMPGTGYGNMTELQCIVDVKGFELPVQVIELNPGSDLEQDVREHDFSFCQIWHDGSMLKVTWPFMMTVGTKLVTLEHCEDQRQFDRSMRRWNRLSQKYPEMKLVIPDRFRQYEDPSL